MWLFLDYVSYAFHKIDEQNAYIIAGAVLGFFIQVVIIILWDSKLNYDSKKQTRE